MEHLHKTYSDYAQKASKQSRGKDRDKHSFSYAEFIELNTKSNTTHTHTCSQALDFFWIRAREKKSAEPELNAMCSTTPNGNHNDTFNESGFSIFYLFYIYSRSFASSSIFPRYASVWCCCHRCYHWNMPASTQLHFIDGLFLVVCIFVNYFQMPEATTNNRNHGRRGVTNKQTTTITYVHRAHILRINERNM